MATTDKGMYIYHWNCGSITAKEREKGLHTLIKTQIEVVRSLGIDTGASAGTGFTWTCSPYRCKHTARQNASCYSHSVYRSAVTEAQKNL